MKAIAEVRPSPIAGQWYPGDARRLASLVDGFITGAHLPELEGEVVAVMAPHAGHRYSGPVAGSAFAALRGLSPEVVAVVSPMHYFTSEPLLTTAHAAYATPLGDVQVDRERLDQVDACLHDELGFGLARVANDPEHSLEIELPFLQRALKAPFLLLPVMIREQSAQVALALGKALGKALKGRPALLVASSDLSHFYPLDVAKALDAEVLRRVGEFDPLGVLKVEEEGKGFACGRGAVAAVLWAAKELGADTARVLNYATSGDVTGDYDRVVGYGAAVFLRRNLTKEITYHLNN